MLDIAPIPFDTEIPAELLFKTTDKAETSSTAAHFNPSRLLAGGASWSPLGHPPRGSDNLKTLVLSENFCAEGQHAFKAGIFTFLLDRGFSIYVTQGKELKKLTCARDLLFNSFWESNTVWPEERIYQAMANMPDPAQSVPADKVYVFNDYYKLARLCIRLTGYDLLPPTNLPSLRQKSTVTPDIFSQYGGTFDISQISLEEKSTLILSDVKLNIRSGSKIYPNIHTLRLNFNPKWRETNTPDPNQIAQLIACFPNLTTLSLMNAEIHKITQWPKTLKHLTIKNNYVKVKQAPDFYYHYNDAIQTASPISAFDSTAAKQLKLKSLIVYDEDKNSTSNWDDFITPAITTRIICVASEWWAFFSSSNKSGCLNLRYDEMRPNAASPPTMSTEEQLSQYCSQMNRGNNIKINLLDSKISCLNALNAIPSLKEFTLQLSAPSDAHSSELESLQDNHTLEHITIRFFTSIRCNYFLQLIQKFKAAKKITISFNMSTCVLQSDSPLPIFKEINTVQELEFEGSFQVPDNLVDFLNQFTALKALKLSIPTDCTYQWENLKSMPNLEWLGLPLKISGSSPLLNEKFPRQPRRYTTEPISKRFSIPFENTQDSAQAQQQPPRPIQHRGTQNPHLIYDDLSNRESNAISSSTTPTFAMTPVCQALDGQPEIKKTRNTIRCPDFEKGNIYAELKALGLEKKTIVSSTGANIPDGLKKCADLQRKAYLFEYTTNANDFIEYQGNTYLRLKGLTPDDRLQHFHSQEVLLEEFYYCHSDHAYYVKVENKNPLKINYQLAVPFQSAILQEKNCFIDALPEQIQTLIKEHENFDGVNLLDVSDAAQYPNLIKKLEAFYRTRKGTCLQRTLSFLYQFKKLKDSTLKKELENIEALQVSNGSHAWVTLKNCKTGEMVDIDLGGSPANLDFQPLQDNSALRPVQISSSSSPSSPLPAPLRVKKAPLETRKVTTLQSLDNISFPPEKNHLLIFESQQSLNTLLPFLQTKLQNALLVDHASQTKHSNPIAVVQEDTQTFTVQPPPAGFITKNINGKDTILLDLSRLSAQELAQINTLLDTHPRKADGIELKSIGLVALVVEGDDRLKDPSFISRMDTISKVDVTRPPASPQNNKKPLVPINLYESDHFMTLLFYDLYPNGEQGKIDVGYFLNQIRAGGKSFTFLNPPQNNTSFDRLLLQLRTGAPITAENEVLAFPPLSITCTQQYDLSNQGPVVSAIYTDVNIHHVEYDHIVTASTLERCLYLYGPNSGDNNGPLYRHPGWIESSAKTEISLYITEPLSTSQYLLLLDAAQKHQKTLSLYLAKNSELPEILTRSLAAKIKNFEAQLSTSVPQTNATVFLADAVEAQADALLQEDPNAILIDVSDFSDEDLLYRYRPDYQDSFRANQIISDIWEKLKNPGSHIILIGHFSKTLEGHLASLLAPEGYLWVNGQKEIMNGRLSIIPDKNSQAHFSWTAQQQVVEIKNPCPPNPSHPEIVQKFNPIADDFTETSYQQFNQARIENFQAGLKRSPCMTIEGPPAAGKSSFARILAKEHQNEYTVYRNLRAWAQDKSSSKEKLLIIDEATLLDTDGLCFEGLFHANPHILVSDPQGSTLFNLDAQHKVVFLQNPGKAPCIQQKYPNKILFSKLSPAYIYHAILKPILGETESTEKVAQEIIENAAGNIRQMQTQAMLHVLQTQNSIKSANGLTSDNFILTDSRKKIAQTLLNVLAIREFKQAAPETNEAARYGGKSGLHLSGPAGVGKTDLIKHVLQSQGFSEFDFLGEDDLEKIDDKKYIHLPASFSTAQKLKYLTKAFDQGLIVVIDEFDTQLDELKAHWNSFLMGEDLEGRRPTKAGFTLLTTGNGGHFNGRDILLESFTSRVFQATAEEYTADEAPMVIKALPEFKENPHIDVLLKQYENGEILTFRDLIKQLREPVPVLSPAPAPAPNTWLTRLISPALIFYSQVGMISLLVGLALAITEFETECFGEYFSENPDPFETSAAVGGMTIAAVTALCLFKQLSSPMRLISQATTFPGTSQTTSIQA